MNNPRSTLSIILLGAAGLVVSWGFFSTFFAEHGADMALFWSEALWGAGGISGLTWDLVFSAIIVTVMSIRDRKLLGARGTAGVVLTTTILGVCGGLALYVALLSRKASSDDGGERE